MCSPKSCFSAPSKCVNRNSSCCAPKGRSRGDDVRARRGAPGPTATALLPDGQPQEVVDHLPKLAPVERIGEPQDIAVAALLARPDGSWINGQVRRANGGIV